MRSKILGQYFAIFLFSFCATSTSPSVADQTRASHIHKSVYKVVFQVTDGDAKKWNLTLVNALNVIAELGKNNVSMEIVVYGPAIDMLRIESEVAPRVSEAIANGVKVVACENTMHGDHITSADMLPDIQYVKSGVVHLMKKQKEGYAYIRP